MEYKTTNETAFDTVRLVQRGATAWITLSRPDALNSISPRMLGELSALIDLVEQSPQVRVLVITGAGRAFCAGADLKSVKAIADAAGQSADASAMSFHANANALLNRIERLRLPVIAAVNGFALAGGLELVLVCDLVVAAASARFGDAHARYGLVPGWGGSVRLPRRIGAPRAKQLMFTAEPVDAATMAAWGLVNTVVPDEQLEAATQALCDQIGARSPLGLRRMKQLVDDGLAQPIEVALRAERSAVEAHFHSHDRREGLAAFAEKRAPLFEGR